MLKKLMMLGAVVLAGLVALKTTALGSLVQVAWKDTRASLERAVPPEVQIKQLQVEIDKVDADIKKHLGTLAAQEVEHQGLEDNVTALRDLISRLRNDVAALTKRLESATEKVSIGRDPKVVSLSSKLDSLVATLESKKLELKGKEQLLTAKKQALDAAHQRITEMREQKEKLRVTAARLETRYEMVRLKGVQNKVEIDDSQVTRCNTLANKIEARLREKEKLADLHLQYGYRSEVPALESEPRATATVLEAARRALADEDGSEDADASSK